jgi:protein translocase SecG subunit
MFQLAVDLICSVFGFAYNILYIILFNLYCNFLFILHAILCLSLIVLVLLQKNSQSDKTSTAAFVPRGRMDLMTYVTAGLAFLVLTNTLVMNIYINKDNPIHSQRRNK